MFTFITKKPLWANIAAAAGLLLLIVLLFLGSLQLITRHGKTMKIPQVTGLSISEARKTLESQGFEVQIQDSTYLDTVPPLQVIKQVPEADNLVKVNRIVYLVVNQAIAPFVAMPNLVSMSFRNAMMVLGRYGIKLKDTAYKHDFAKNSVLDQLYNDQTIKPGTQIQHGSAISLVLGDGAGGYDFAVPDLFGLTYQEARLAMQADGLIMGAVVPDKDVSDTSTAYIYRQSPEQFDDEKKLNRIRQGQTIDIFLTSQKPVRKTDSLDPQPPPK